MDTTEHSKQLVKYYNAVYRAREQGDLILGVFYKSGFLYDHDRRVLQYRNQELTQVYSLPKDPYLVYGRERLMNMMGKYVVSKRIKSDIFKDYYDYLSLKIRHDKAVEEAVKAGIGSNELFRRHLAQWFALKSVLPAEDETLVYDTGTSAGKPWVQCSIILEEESADLPDGLFYRLDDRTGGYYISLRQYLNYDDAQVLAKLNSQDKPTIKRNKLMRLEQLKKIAEEALRVCSKSS